MSKKVIYNPIDIYYCLKKPNYSLLDDKDTCLEFKNNFNSNKSFCAGRIGMTEAYCLRVFEFGYNRKYEDACNQLCMWSGFFPNNVDFLPDFFEVYKESLKNFDYVSPLKSRGEEYLLKKYCNKDVKYIKSTENCIGEYSWMKFLKGKRVLVIHPFEQSIRKQYERRQLIFDNYEDNLPEFELLTLKAVQTIADEKDSRFNTWFEALDYMKSEVDKVDFDVALLGCGAYGVPLSAYIKRKGKSAIYVGGGLQLMFGIMGSRWEQNPQVTKLINEYWIRPNESETPGDSVFVENNCYW